jgi:hypothetical protein
LERLREAFGYEKLKKNIVRIRLAIKFFLTKNRNCWSSNTEIMIQKIIVAKKVIAYLKDEDKLEEFRRHDFEFGQLLLEYFEAKQPRRTFPTIRKEEEEEEDSDDSDDSDETQTLKDLLQRNKDTLKEIEALKAKKEARKTGK